MYCETQRRQTWQISMKGGGGCRSDQDLTKGGPLSKIVRDKRSTFKSFYAIKGSLLRIFRDKQQVQFLEFLRKAIKKGLLLTILRNKGPLFRISTHKFRLDKIHI